MPDPPLHIREALDMQPPLASETVTFKKCANYRTAQFRFNQRRGRISPNGIHQNGMEIDFGVGEPHWIVGRDRKKWDTIFHSLNPIRGKIYRSTALNEMAKSRLPSYDVAKIWRLADVDQDGAFDDDEFSLAMYLINMALNGQDVPNDLPHHLIPPSKKEGKYNLPNFMS